MIELKVSKRLEKLVDWIQTGTTLADIGSDHAYLPVYAYQMGKIKLAVAGEVNEGPYLSAKETVESYGLQNVIEVRKGDGLEVLRPNEVHTIVIAGMGGALIRSILEKGQTLLKGQPHLILQPNNGEETLRKWLYNSGWAIGSEWIMEEDGHIYEAMSVKSQSSKEASISSTDLIFGPILRIEKSPIFIKKWQRELEKWERIQEEITSQAENLEGLDAKRAAIQARIDRIREAIQ